MIQCNQCDQSPFPGHKKQTHEYTFTEDWMNHIPQIYVRKTMIQKQNKIHWTCLQIHVASSAGWPTSYYRHRPSTPLQYSMSVCSLVAGCRFCRKKQHHRYHHGPHGHGFYMAHASLFRYTKFNDQQNQSVPQKGSDTNGQYHILPQGCNKTMGARELLRHLSGVQNWI